MENNMRYVQDCLSAIRSVKTRLGKATSILDTIKLMQDLDALETCLDIEIKKLSQALDQELEATRLLKVLDKAA